MKALRALLLWGVILGGLMAIFVAGSGPADHYWLEAPEWSRAQRVATANISTPTPLVADAAGDLYLFTIERDPQRTDLALLRPNVRSFGTDGTQRWHYQMPVVLTDPQQSQMLFYQGALYLFWLDVEGVTQAVVNLDGSLNAAPTVLVAADAANSYSVAAATGTASADRLALWTGGSRGEPGVSARWIDGAGNNPGDTSDPVLIDAEGLAPQLQVDEAGTLHAIWYRFPLRGDLQFFHGRDPAGAPADYVVQPLLAWPIDIRSELRSYAFGVRSETLDLFWTELANTGDRIRSVQTYYARSVLSQSTAALPLSPPQLLTLSALEDAAGAPSAFLEDAMPNNLSPARPALDALTAAFSVQVPNRQTQNTGQIGLLHVTNDAFSARLLTTSSAASFAPTLIVDTAGDPAGDQTRDQYVAWLERASAGAGYHVYLAGTSPGWRTGLSRLTVNDVARVASNVLFGMAAGALLGPIVLLLWVVGPWLLLGIVQVWRGEWVPPLDREFAGRVGAAILLFWMGKLLTIPALNGYVPFAEWVPVMPSLWGLILRGLVPVFIVTVSVIGARAFLRRVESPSPGVFVTAYAVTDSVLTAAVYGGLLYERFFRISLLG